MTCLHQLFNYSIITRLFNIALVRMGTIWIRPFYIIHRPSQDSSGMEFKKENQESLRPPRSMVSSNKSKPIAVSPSLAILPIHHLIVIQGNALARSKYSSGFMKEKHVKKPSRSPHPFPDIGTQPTTIFKHPSLDFAFLFPLRLEGSSF